MNGAETRLYHAVRRIRRVEEVIAEIYPSDKIRSPVHLSIGQEAVAVGVCDVLGRDDVVAMTYRGHAAYLAKGGDLKAMMAELYVKATGSAGGRGGSMHLISMDHYVLGGSAVVATSIPVAVGYAFALKKEKKNRVVACYFGDGATEEGAFYESINFSSLHALPILFVCENNGFAIHQPLEDRWATPDVCKRVEAFGIPAEQIVSGDIFDIRNAAQSAVAQMKSKSDGPHFLECHTYRWREHVGPNEDYQSGYRDRADASAWFDNDPVEQLGKTLAADVRVKIDYEIESEIKEALQFAEQSPFPDESELEANVFAV